MIIINRTMVLNSLIKHETFTIMDMVEENPGLAPDGERSCTRWWFFNYPYYNIKEIQNSAELQGL